MTTEARSPTQDAPSPAGRRDGFDASSQGED